MTITRTYETCTVIIDRCDDSGPYSSRWSGYARIDAEATAQHIRDNGGAAVVAIKTFDVEIPAGYESIYQPGIAERVSA